MECDHGMPPKPRCSSPQAEEAAAARLFDVVVQFRSRTKVVLKTRYLPDVLSPAARYTISRRSHNREFFTRTGAERGGENTLNMSDENLGMYSSSAAHC